VLIASPNIGFDHTARLDELRPGHVLRFTSVTVTAGGKGVNVARAARDLGCPARLVGFAAGRTGSAAIDHLLDEGIPVVGVPIAGEARVNTIVLEESGRVTVMNEPGPSIGEAEWRSFEEAIATHLQEHQVFVAIGSLPPGAPADAYARLVHLASAVGLTTIVDASGQTLAMALSAHPDIVTPNLFEAEALVRGAVDERVEVGEVDVRERALEAAKRLRELGAVAALVTAGSAGVALASADASGWVTAPMVTVRNPIGAGDAFVAGLASALERGRAIQEAVLEAVAAGAASVETPLAGHLDPDRARALLGGLSLQIDQREAP